MPKEPLQPSIIEGGARGAGEDNGRETTADELVRQDIKDLESRRSLEEGFINDLIVQDAVRGGSGDDPVEFVGRPSHTSGVIEVQS